MEIILRNGTRWRPTDAELSKLYAHGRLLLLNAHGEYEPVSLTELNDLYKRSKVGLRDMILRRGQHMLVGEVLGHSLGRATFGINGIPLETAPSISWLTVLMIGGMTGGYGLAAVALFQGIWSRNVQRRLAPVILPLVALIVPPTDLAWGIASIIRDHTHIHILRDLLHLGLALLLMDAFAVVCTLLASLSVRRSLVNRLGPEGFRMAWLPTLLFGPAMVAYKLNELRDMSVYH